VPDLGHVVAPTASTGSATGSGARADVREALSGLGYSDAEIREVMSDLPDDGDAGLLLKDALQRLAVSRR
jgi:Holliday junction resolvasome RuvABC DNA-binding subunit